MKICLIADAISVHTQKWAQYFAKQGNEVHLISYESSDLDYNGVEVHVISSRFKNLYVSFIPRHIRIYLLVKRLKPDIVHAHFITKFGYHAAFLNYSPVIMSAWGSDILLDPMKSKFIWHITKYSLQKADFVYGVSQDLCDKIIFNFDVSSSKVKLVPNGVDLNIFYPVRKENCETGSLVVLSNRKLFDVYSIDTLIKSIPHVIEENKNITFFIAGYGPLENDLKRLVDDLKLNDYVSFIGEVDNNEMVGLLRQCDIYVSTSLSDGTPVSMLEAMACGKACIMTDVGGVSEWIEDGVSGCLFTPKDQQMLASKILELAFNSKLRTEFGKNAFSFIHKRGDWDKIMANVRNHYIDLVYEK